MADIAQIGFAADTSELKDAKASLDALVPAAKKAERAADSLAKSNDKVAQAAGRVRDANGKFVSAANAAAAGMSATTSAANAASGAIERKASWVSTLIARLRGLAPAADAAAAGLKRVNAVANDNFNNAQATPGNIAAQFQDIGVTAAMGMNPLLIALQQGTQLSSAFAGPGGVGAIGAAFKQLLSPTALLTIGIVGLVAAGLQMVDWVKVAQFALNGLADIIVDIAPYAVAAAGALALIYAPAIIGGVVSLTRGFIGLAASMLAAIGIPALIVAGLVAIVAAANHFRDDLTRILGFDIVAAAKNGVNFIISAFVAGFNTLKLTWRELPFVIGDVTIQAANATIRTIARMVNTTIEAINGLLSNLPSWMGVGSNGITFRMSEADAFNNPLAGSAAGMAAVASQEFDKARQTDWLGGAIDFIRDGAARVGDALRSAAAGLGADEKKKKTRKGPKTDAEKFEDIATGANNYIRDKRAEAAALGLTAFEAAKLTHQTDLLNKATAQGITLTPQMKQRIEELAAGMARADVALSKATFMHNFNRDASEAIAGLQLERDALFMTEHAARAAQIEFDYLAQARQKNIDLTPADIAAIKGVAAEQAALEIEVRRTREAIDFTKDAARGFIGDLRGNLAQGQTLFQAFGNAVINVLDKVADRLMSIALDAAFAGGGGGGGFGGFLAGLFGGGKAYAKGGAFSGGVQFFAKGGVVDGATAFGMRGGLGVMGEKDPEAIMPLKRGPDGSLGVQMYRGGRGATNASTIEVIVRAEEGDMFRPVVRTVAQDEAIKVTNEGLRQYDDALPTRVNQIASDERAR